MELIERMAAMEQDNKAINRRLSNLEKLTESVHTIATEMKEMRGDVTDITERVSEIEKKPSKRWEAVMAAFITAIISGAVGYLLRGGM